MVKEDQVRRPPALKEEVTQLMCAYTQFSSEAASVSVPPASLCYWV